ncbi:hypothetical protein SASPL_147356 [Salvia splendens]|uniref:Uncharacterized protein n=1 Tax=Salvia splendens TaxID=180675 RepID=A0A8X8WF06_SALSN|nr:hypothetical protein SASPL_147356 [Salvia splendens]
MSNRNVDRTESMVVTSAGVTRDLEQFQPVSGALDSTSLAFEHILATLARFEARLDASERRQAIAQPPLRPDHDPPYDDGLRGRGDAGRHRPVVSDEATVASQQHGGFAAASDFGVVGVRSLRKWRRWSSGETPDSVG